MFKKLKMKYFPIMRVVAIFILTSFLISPQIFAAEAGAEQAEVGDKAQISLAEASKQLSNPVSNLWSLVLQYDMTVRDIEDFGDNQILHNFKFQPVMPIPLTEKWRVIVRPVFQLNAFDIPDVPSGPTPGGGAGLPLPPPPLPPGFQGGRYNTDFGLGDTIFLTAFSNSDPKGKWMYGFGPTWVFPTATEKTLGADNWSVGPGGALIYLGDPGSVIAGGLIQHWWSFAGDGPEDTNLTDFQYIFRYRATPTVSIGFAPNIQVDWEKDDWSIPVGGGIDITTKIGKTPLKFVFEAYYYVDQFEGFDNQFGLRILISPVISAPKWANKPLFGRK